MGNIDELNLFTHLLDHTGIAANVGIIERRIHLVEHAEWCRIELENREYQRNRRQCLFTA